MIGRTFYRAVIFAALGLLVATSFATLAATNTVPPTRAGIRSQAISTSDLKPGECTGLNLQKVVAGSGTINGTSGNDLILGGSGADAINGNGGDDCILGGGGDDTLDGGDGSDVCLGGAGTDTFVNQLLILLPTCEVALQS